MKSTPLTVTVTVTILALMTVGCDSDQRLAEIASRSMEMQARQNARTADMQKDISAGARQLVEADSAARQETLAMQRELQQEHATIGEQRDSLEEDRRQIASQRYLNPIIANAITQVGITLACVLPLVICWQLLKHRSEPADDQQVADILLNDLVTANPVLLIPEGKSTGIAYQTASDPSDIPELPHRGADS